ncbi:MAG TPA: BadF/BadG/BcrA/BcrD ATPase family protein [Propionicimonas sp.]|jgi:glucosamine kinase
MKTAQLVVAVDGGQSSTTCLVGDLEGRPLGWARSGPIWHLGEVGGPERVRHALVGSITGALRNADRPASEVRHAFLSLTGATGFAASMARELLGAATVTSVSDALGALASGTFGGPGVAIVVGTGSVAVAVGDDGREEYRGGWGPTLGDQGSAYRIGLSALQAVALAADGVGPDTALLPAVRDSLSLADPRELFDQVYTGQLDRTRIASLAPLVARFAQMEDPVAATIIAEATTALVRLGATTAAAVELRGEHRRVVLTGGVLLSNQEMGEAVARRLVGELPSFRVIRPLAPPIVGAFALAMRACGIDAASVLPSRLLEPQWPQELISPNHPRAARGNENDD